MSSDEIPGHRLSAAACWAVVRLSTVTVLELLLGGGQGRVEGAAKIGFTGPAGCWLRIGDPRDRLLGGGRESLESICATEDVDERRLFSTTPSTGGAMTTCQSYRPWDAWSSAGGRKPRKLRVTVSQALEGRATVTSTTGPVGPQSDPDSPDDPFASPAPWAGLHETWADLSASDDGRERALALFTERSWNPFSSSELRTVADFEGL